MTDRRSLLLSSLASLLVLAAGCAEGGEPPGAEATMRSGQPIINGTADTTHDAVVAVLGETSQCTGTIILKDPALKLGHVLSAARCCKQSEPKQVVVGADYSSGPAYPVLDYRVNPQYDGNAYDFCMVTFLWSGDEPPAIPALTMAQDDMAVGSTVDFVGYGVTDVDPSSAGYDNTVRHEVSGQIDQLDALTIHYNQSAAGPYANDSGPCERDWGGPALYTVPGVGETVAAVASHGDPACAEYSVSSRVPTAEDWIKGYIAESSLGFYCTICTSKSVSLAALVVGATCPGERAPVSRPQLNANLRKTMCVPFPGLVV